MDNYRDIFLIQQIYGTLFALSNKVQMEGDKYFDELTSRQFMAMIAIIHLPEDETTLNNIARKLGNTKQSVKQLITIIENKGYVMTVPSKQDKRAVNVQITESGKNILKECGEKSMNFMADLSRDLTSSEMEILWILLKKLYRFDGEEQDGFEEEAHLDTSENINDPEVKAAIEKFAKRRNERR